MIDNHVYASSRPILIAPFRGDLNQTAEYNLYSQYLKHSDFAVVLPNSNTSVISKLPSTPVLIASSLSSLTTTVLNHNFNWVLYDLEKNSGAEYNDYVNSTKTAYQIAHANGYNLIITPAYPDLPIYDRQIAPYGDMIVMQIPQYMPTFVSSVNQLVTDIKSVNPNAVVILQLITLDPGVITAGPNTSNVTKIINLWNSVKNTPQLSGLQIYFFNNPDPIPLIQQIYDGIGISKGNNTVLTLNSIANIPWGGNVSLSGNLANSTGAGIAGRTITFNGTGINFPSVVTKSDGTYIVRSHALNTTSNWIVQAHFSGYNSSPADSIVQAYSTLIHNTSLSLKLSSPNVLHGTSFTLSGVLRDLNGLKTLRGQTISFFVNPPFVIPSTVTTPNGSFQVTLTAPATSGKYIIHAHFSGNNLYHLKDSLVTLSVT